eukprot:1160850-Pelagomonas_calceolata.AAC.5
MRQLVEERAKLKAGFNWRKAVWEGAAYVISSACVWFMSSRYTHMQQMHGAPWIHAHAGQAYRPVYRLGGRCMPVQGVRRSTFVTLR